MSYWRKLFIVVLLALSLPAQSFAAVSMKCVLADADAGKAPLAYAEHDLSARGLASQQIVAPADDDEHRQCDTCHAHSCSTCAPGCCFGIALPAAPTVATPPDATRVLIRISPSAHVMSFLTGGIERPPRYTLV